MAVATTTDSRLHYRVHPSHDCCGARQAMALSEQDEVTTPEQADIHALGMIGIQAPTDRNPDNYQKTRHRQGDYLATPKPLF